jgi:pimeloyl-ACP methyl ester carboxylesterase
MKRTRLEIDSIGPKSSTALVLLHEGLGSISAWRDFPRRLHEATGLPLLMYSRAGYGGSPLRERWPIEFMQEEAALLPELLASEGIGDPILFGHSDGATIALYYAKKHPPRGVILEAPHLFVEQKTVDEIARLGDDMIERLARHHDHPAELFRGWTGVWLDPNFRHWRIDPPRLPTLVIQGEDDRYGTLAQLEPFEGERLILDKCGHSPHRDRPDDVLAASARFVKQLLRL